MSKCKLEFTLKQHTPMIHFQSEQKGATLRATELKPKLDKFLIEYAFGNDKALYEKFLIDKDKGALDYKVKIEINESHSDDISEDNPLYFAARKPREMSQTQFDAIKKRFKLYSSDFKICFFSFSTKLIEIITENFEAFLANTNFGTRQSKGFGGFYLSGKSFDGSLVRGRVYSFSSTNWQNDIKLFYAFLRQGINLPTRNGTRFYSKPVIFLYAKKQGWEWDKKAIKGHFFSGELSSQQKKYDKESPVKFSAKQKYLLRDLFGLSKEESWMFYRATVKKENSSIDRFKSPLTFKYIDGKVYFWANDTIEDMLDKTFTISTRGNSPLDLKTPKKFDFNAFFEFVKNIELKDVVEDRFHSQNEYRDLTRMLKNMKVAS